MDGARGAQSQKIADHREACRGISTPEETQYEQGRQKGLSFFCTAQGAYYAGKHGLNYPSLCGARNGDVNLNTYKLGVEVGGLQAQSNFLNSSVQKAREEEDKESTLIKLIRIFTGQKPQSEELETQRLEIENQIHLRQSSFAPPGSEQFEKEISKTHPTTPLVGAGVGTFLGFGSGQLVQGRYLKVGWLHTVAQGSAILMAPLTGGLSILGFLTSKFFEIKDVWTHGLTAYGGYPHLRGKDDPPPHQLANP